MAARPVSAKEVAEAVHAHAHVAAAGGRTKKPLVGEGEVIEMGGLSGIAEYEASEYTFTARAGTPVREVEGALKEKRQYLPFDPLFVEGGATLGGTIAAGVSGPGRFRYGGLRDFLIGVEFVDGSGRLVRSGGKVVKNAAGFDLPKFLVGSLGRFGIVTEVSFKVFPAPVETVTLRVSCANHEVAGERLAEVARSRWEAEALDYDLAARCMVVRLGGPGRALDLLCGEIESRWRGEVERVDPETAAEGWADFREWAGAAKTGSRVVKIPMTLSQFGPLREGLEEVGAGGGRLSSGGAVWWLAVDEDRMEGVHAALEEKGFAGLVVRGEPWSSPWIGRREMAGILGAVKEALDPVGRFPGL